MAIFDRKRKIEEVEEYSESVVAEVTMDEESAEEPEAEQTNAAAPITEEIMPEVATTRIKRSDEIELKAEHFGDLYQFIVDDNITDVDYNGRAVWTTACDGTRVRQDVVLDHNFVTIFCNRIKNGMKNVEFNKFNPKLEAETLINGISLRITVFHESIAVTGTSICIRKTPPFARINMEDALESGYITPRMLAFVLNCVKGHLSIVISGEPGVGKTEFAKFLSTFIPDAERVITIEDNLEWHYAELKPNADSVSLQVQASMSHKEAIETCMRQGPKWMMIAEVRGNEVNDYISGITTGVVGITTIHTDDARNIPERMVNMSSDSLSRDRLENQIYEFVNLGIQIKRRARNGEPEARFVDQMVLFSKEHNSNIRKVLFTNQQECEITIPSRIQDKLKDRGVTDVFKNAAVDQAIKNMEASGRTIKYDDRNKTTNQVAEPSREMKPFPTTEKEDIRPLHAMKEREKAAN